MDNIQHVTALRGQKKTLYYGGYNAIKYDPLANDIFAGYLYAYIDLLNYINLFNIYNELLTL
ncbi:hypothetical protein ABN09_08380 [Morganella morganii]|nr:hypothetical protein ABN09_08380 [Morganella morganii]